MKRTGTIIVCLLFLLLAVHIPKGHTASVDGAADSPKGVRDFRSELIGAIWHASPVLGSGWSQRLVLLDDAKFIYAANEMDGETRERFITGDWSVNPNGILTLFCREALKWEGGEIVPATASTATATEIINASLVKIEYDPVKAIEIRVGDYVYDDSTPRPWKICLPDEGAICGGDGWWWKYEGDWDLNDLRDSYRNALEQTLAGDEYRLLPVGHISGKPFYIDYAVFFREHMPEFEVGKNIVKFDDKYGVEQEVIWIWFEGGVEEARIYELLATDDWENLALGRELFSVVLGPNDVIEFHTQIPESVPHTAVWFKTSEGQLAYALGYNGRTGAVNAIPVKLK